MAVSTDKEGVGMEDTISAISTAPGEGGIGIIRISGFQALIIAQRLFMSPSGHCFDHFDDRRVYYGCVVDPNTDQAVDEVVLFAMKAPHSYTCEDIVELQCHGGMVVQKKILALTLQCGARLAEPGEFTKRAFMNGRLDLTQAEAVIDVIRAKSEVSLHTAVRQLGGNLKRAIQQICHELLGLMANIEALIDFPEDEIEELHDQQARSVLHSCESQLEQLLNSAVIGRVLHDGLRTVIIGKPNVGKSSLLNALLDEQKAIVTSVPGTTRDVIEDSINIQGIPLQIVDTAGIRSTDDPVEKIGVEKSRDALAEADLVLFVLDRSQVLTAEDEQIALLAAERKKIVILNKCDLSPQISNQQVTDLVGSVPIVKLSLVQHDGLEQLKQQIYHLVYSGQVMTNRDILVTNVRQEHALQGGLDSIRAALSALEQDIPLDLIAVDVRDAWEMLGLITGNTVQENLLDEIFSRFCIGK